MSRIEENTVSSAHQTEKKGPVFFLKTEGEGQKILFVGNSITLHLPKPDIGWYGSWGMAASCAEKDYVHMVMEKQLETDAKSRFAVCHVSDWERGYRTGESFFNAFLPAREFGADVIIMRCVENCPHDERFNGALFRQKYQELIDYLNPEGKAKVILTTGFWRHVGNQDIRAVAKERGYALVELEQLGEDDSMMAIGLFEHRGVSIHPGDKGMAAIAEKILQML
ncbi:MAG: SGNH/GDSL hydrolase family protein [Clostridia bacterium]|nr:SGNH/GDSL hydrolase family protein [Clostridia bacterium]